MDKRIDEVQRDEGEYFVYLKKGWHLDGAHCFGETDRTGIRETMKRVQRCECEECIKSCID